MLHAGVPSPRMLGALEGRRSADRAGPSGTGYTNLFGKLPAGSDEEGGASLERYEHRLTGEEAGEAAESLFVRLGRLLAKPYPWPAQESGDPDDNPRIPSGYTYFAQLVAHDLTFFASGLPPVEVTAAEQKSFRTVALDLETIYGGGPTECPSAFQRGTKGGPRSKLKLGLMDGWETRPAEARAGLARDLPRAACPDNLGAIPGEKGRLTEVLIADPRNDDHIIVGQTAVLFHLLHNAVCERLADNPAAFSPEHADEDRPAASYTARERDVFTSSRRLVASVYRSIIRHDLLAKLLCEPVYRHYTTAEDPFLDPTGGGTMPVEFSHAAFRVGHAMIRAGYKIRTSERFALNDILWFNSDLGADLLPPPRSWIVRWSRFYDLSSPGTGTAPPVEFGPFVNFSRRLAPSYTRTLSTSSRISVMDDRDDPELRTGLPRRDLLRGGTTRMRSVESIIAHVRRAAPGLLDGSRLLRDTDPRERRAAVRTFLATADGSPDAFTDEEKDLVAKDPPLLLFLLLEAALEQDGFCLGVLGSVIVGEVIFRALDAADRVEAGKAPETDALSLAAFGYDPATVNEGPRRPAAPPRSMPDLIRFLADLPALSGADPAFL